MAILNKKKKLSFDAEFDPRHQNYEVQIDANAVVADTDQVVPISDARKAIPELNNSSPQAMSMVAKNVTSVTNLPNNPPYPSSITDIPLMNDEKPGEKPEDEEMPPWWTSLMILLGEMNTQEETRRKSSLKWFLLVILFVITDVWCLDNNFSGFILAYV